MFSIDIVILPHFNYSAFKSVEQINKLFNQTYHSLCALELPQELQFSTKLVCNLESQQFFSAFTDKLQANQPTLKPQCLISTDSNCKIANCLAQAIQESQADYLLFLTPGTTLDSNFFSPLIAEFKNQAKVIKTAVMYPEHEVFVDEQYYVLLKSYPVFLCKEFGSLVLQRKFLIESNFLQKTSLFFDSDLGLCTGLSCIFQEQNAQLQEQAQNDSHNQMLLFSTTKQSSARLDLANNELMQIAKHQTNIVLVLKSKMTLPRPEYTQPEQISFLAKELLQVFATFKGIPVKLIGFNLICFLDHVLYCSNSQLKMQVVQECLHLYQSFLQVTQAHPQSQLIQDTLAQTLDTISKTSLSQAFKEQDSISLLEAPRQRFVRNTLKRLKDFASDHSCHIEIEQKLKQTLRKVHGLPQNLLFSDAQASSFAPFLAQSQLAAAKEVASNLSQPTSVDSTQPTTLTELNLSQPTSLDSNQPNTTDTKPHATDNSPQCSLSSPLNNTQPSSLPSEKIYVVSAVNDIALYHKLFLNNPLLKDPQLQLCPLLNPDPNTPEQVLGLATLYNRFIEQLDLAKPCWLVFCHNDLEFLEPLSTVLANLDPNYIYGPAGAFITTKNQRLYQAFVGYNFEHAPRRDLMNNARINSNFHRFPQDVEKYVVDTLDCFCLVVHSSLLQRYNMRFDEKLRFDLVTEDFCINAKYNYQIPSKLLNITITHHSNSDILYLPPSYFASLKYLNQKYPNIAVAGTCSLIGGAVKKDEYFFN